MLRLILVVLFIACIMCSSRVSAQAADIGHRLLPSEILKQVPPEYPLEARRKHQTGSGSLILHIDEQTGEVTSVAVEKTTGYKLLDDAGIRAFSQWRFKPGAARKIRMPIHFSLPRGT
jgi:TonB family protein